MPVVWLSKDHVLAEFDEFSQADLADENVLFASDRDSIDLATYYGVFRPGRQPEKHALIH